MEIWKDIEGHNGSYQVSNLGNVKSLERTVYRTNGRPIHVKERMLKQRDNGRGYKMVVIGGLDAVHRLVAKAFCENPYGYKEVDHIDGDKNNNNAENLEWVTRSENIKRSYQNNLRTCHDMNGNKNPMAKFSVEEVKEMRRLNEFTSTTRGQIMNLFGISKSALSAILNYKSWKDC